MIHVPFTPAELRAAMFSLPELPADEAERARVAATLTSAQHGFLRLVQMLGIDDAVRIAFTTEAA